MSIIKLVIDGHSCEAQIAGISVEENGKVVISCDPVKLEQEAAAVVTAEQPESTPVGTPTPRKNRIRNYKFNSALIRFLHDGRLATGAVTHCTDTALRILNLDWGATWVPKSVVRWSEIAGMFCITDENYFLDFTKDMTQEMSEYPDAFNPDAIIEREFSF